MAWLIASLRRLRDERATTVALIALVFVTAFVFAAAPRLFEGIADGAVQTQVREASSFDRNVQLLQVRRIEADRADPLARVEAAGDELQRGLTSSVGALIVDRRIVIDSLRWTILAPTNDPSFMRMRIQPGVEEHVEYVEGRAPTGTLRRIPSPLDPTGESPDVPLFEIALSRASAAAVGAELGDVIPLAPDATDVLVGRGNDVEFAVAAEVVGLYDVPDTADPFWMDDTALTQPSYRGPTLLARLVDVSAVLAPEAYGDLLGETNASRYPLRYTWRYIVDPERVKAAATARLVVDLRRLESTFPSDGGGPAATTLRSGLLPLMETWMTRWGSATTLLGVIAVGPIVVAVAALAMVILLAVARRRPSLELSRGRGASTIQVIGSATAEGLLLTVPAAALAILAAIVVLPTGSPRTSVIAALAIALAATLLMVLAVVPTAFAAPRGPGRDVGVRRVSTRRLLLEGLVVVLAIVGAYVLRDRGIGSVASVGDAPASDPLIAAVPALAGLAAGLILVRLLPIPVRLLGRLAGRRRDLVPVLAMRRAAGGGSAGAVLLVLMAATAIGAFSLTTLLHFDQAADDIAWQQVGAPYLLTGGVAVLPSDLDPVTFPEVDARAGTFKSRAVYEARRLPLELVAIDVADLGPVVDGTPGDPQLPASMLTPSVPPGTPYPVIVSSAFGEGTQALAVGDQFTLPVEARLMMFRIEEIRDRYPGVDEGVPFVIASRDQLRADRTDGFRTTSAFYIRADDSAATAEAIREQVRASAPFADLTGRVERTDELRMSPIIDAIVLGVALAGLLAALYAALAISAALALAGTAQAVEVAHLRTMGLTRREAFGLIVVEHGPTTIIGFVAGLAFGVALFGVVQPGLGLDRLVGSSLDIPVSLGLDQLLAIGLFVVAIAALGIGLGAFLQRRAIPASAIRRGFE